MGKRKAMRTAGEGKEEGDRERARNPMGKRKAMRTAGEWKEEGDRERAWDQTGKQTESSAARGETGKARSRPAPVGKAPMGWLTVGKVVELYAQKRGYMGAWFQVRITEFIQPDKAAVDYCYFTKTARGKVPHREVAPLKNLRPLPPQLERKSWEALDAVETLDAVEPLEDYTWWQGYVLSFNPKTQTYRVWYDYGHPSLDLPTELIRTHLDWDPVSPGSSKGYWTRVAKMQEKQKKLRIKPPKKSAFTPGEGSPPLPESPEPRQLATPEATSSPSHGGGASGSAGQEVEIITPFLLDPLRDDSTDATTHLGMGAYFQLVRSFRTHSQGSLNETQVRILEDIETELGLPADQCAQAHCAAFSFGLRV